MGRRVKNVGKWGVELWQSELPLLIFLSHISLYGCTCDLHIWKKQANKREKKKNRSTDPKLKSDVLPPLMVSMISFHKFLRNKFNSICCGILFTNFLIPSSGPFNTTICSLSTYKLLKGWFLSQNYLHILPFSLTSVAPVQYAAQQVKKNSNHYFFGSPCIEWAQH